MGMNGMSLGSGVGNGPGTSGMLLPTPLGDRGGLGDHHMGGGDGALKAPAAPTQPNSSNQAVADDASSGYGSPDSLTMEDR